MMMTSKTRDSYLLAPIFLVSQNSNLNWFDTRSMQKETRADVRHRPITFGNSHARIFRKSRIPQIFWGMNEDISAQGESIPFFFNQCDCLGAARISS